MGLLGVLVAAWADGEASAPPAVPAPPAEPDWVDLSVPVDFGSAVGSETTDPTDPATPQEGPSFRGRWSLRPWLGFIGLPQPDGGWGGTAGGMVGHQWWSLRDQPVRPAGETRLRVVAPFGELKGWQAELDATAGVWLGPIGLFGGPALRAERLVWQDGAELAPALTLGPQLRLAARAGPVTPWVAATPSWIVAGARDGLEGPWDEARLDAGIVLDIRPVALRFSASSLWTTAGQTWEGALGLQLRLF